MHINCPHCHNPIELIDESPPALVQCPSCGSRWKPADIGTETIRDTKFKSAGRFQLLELLGTGHFGEVWSAKDPTLDRQVAIKLPRKEDMGEDDIERFLREARAAAQLKHPNIVGVHEVGKEGDLLYIVSDLIRGVSLSDWINAKRLLSFEETAKLCATLADALHYAHEAGVIHRDLKPGNVLLDEHGEPHLTDFGLAKRESGEITMTIEGRILGTPAYMSPEQAGGQGHDADRRSDVYSLGVMLFELLTGQRPFKGNSRLLLQQVMHEEPRSPRKLNSKIPKDLQTICLKAMEKAPAKRYASAKDMADDLRRYLKSEPVVARPISRVEHFRRWTKRNPVVATLTATIIVLVTSMGALYTRQWIEHRPVLRTVVITTEPLGARVVCVPLSTETGEPLADRKVPAMARTPTMLKLEPGHYLVVAEIEGHGFHEVFRYVPILGDTYGARQPHKLWNLQPDGEIAWPVIKIPATEKIVDGMAEFRGGTIKITLPDELAELSRIPPERREQMLKQFPPIKPADVPVDGFYLDTTELTVGECRRLWGKEDNMLPTELEGAESFPNDYPAAYVTYDWAVAFAELAGKRLPTEEEYLFAATNGGTTTYPWGNDGTVITGWKFDKADEPTYDRTPTNPPVFGLYSNVVEWTTSWNTPLPGEPATPLDATTQKLNAESRLVRGGPFSVVKDHPVAAELKYGPKVRNSQHVITSERGLGFRCARSVRPRF